MAGWPPRLAPPGIGLGETGFDGGVGGMFGEKDGDGAGFEKSTGGAGGGGRISSPGIGI